MPPAITRRQPDSPADAWFRSERNLRLIHEVQRQAVPELTRVFGQAGLYLRPAEEVPPLLSGNMLAGVVSLHRRLGGFAGDLRCADAALPLGGGSLALVYALFVLETSPAPTALLAEIARVLKPDGVALILALNPWAPARLRWAFNGLSPMPPAEVAVQARDAGLDVQRSRFLGPVWSPPERMNLHEAGPDGPAARLRMAHLLVTRRRDVGLTPLRAQAAVVGLRPGISHG